MSNEQARNALRYLYKGSGELGPMIRPGCSGFTNAEWILLMQGELRRRS